MENLNHSPSINLDHSSTKGYPALAGKDRRVDGEKLVSIHK